MLKERFSQVSIVDLPPMRVACFRALSRTPEDDAVKVLRQWAAGAGLRETPRSFGFDVPVSPEQAEAGLRGYELWYAVPAHVAAAPPVAIRDFPGGHYAAMTVRDPFTDPFAYIPAGWGALYEWVITHGLEDPNEMLCLEEVIEGEEHQDIVLYYPVRKG